ncbi:MAG TPA: glycosyltransferase [Methanocorpusculum sp.]|nr:glycosyltransferase [Methanocorpusculum sp.]
MNILFAVCGEGLGHASRSTKLAAYLTQHGHTCTFASYGKAYDFIQKQGFPVHEISHEVTLGGDDGLFSLAKTFWLSKTVLISLLLSYRDARRLLKDHRFDLLVADTMYAAGYAARSLGVPNAFITNQNTFASATSPDAAYWYYLSRTVQRYLQKVPDIVIVPDFLPPDTISGYNFVIPEAEISHYRFVGPILDWDPGSVPISEETIFVSFGGESFKLPLYTMIREIADEMPEYTFEVFSTTPGQPKNTRNFRAFGYVPDIRSYLAKSRVAILHGGLTSLMESLSLGKTVVMIIDPYHPEQWNNARKIEEMGAGIMILGNTVTKEKLGDAISRALAMTPPDLRQLLSTPDGREAVCEILESLHREDLECSR